MLLIVYVSFRAYTITMIKEIRVAINCQSRFLIKADHKVAIIHIAFG